MLNTITAQRQIVTDNYPKEVASVSTSCKPFLKWVGGKTQMIPDLIKEAPKKFDTYLEPFIGGGALYFNLGHKKSVISDANEELVITYQEVKSNVEEVINILSTYKNEEEHYYKIRALKTDKLTDSERAARLIYLNKTCFNGLFRVNKKGEFNVPYCKKPGGNFLNKETLHAASNYLQDTTILHADYKTVVKKYAKKGDFIFFDPPYQPISKFSDFKRYTKEFFYENDQIDLATIFSGLVKKGCNVMLTNSDHPFIHELYKDFEIKVIDTKRMVSSNPNTRTGKDIIVLGGSK
jgi:DNA adenine methylase Dam